MFCAKRNAGSMKRDHRQQARREPNCDQSSQGHVPRHSWLNVLSITVWTVVQTVLTATFNAYGIGKFQPLPHKIYTPEPIDKKLGTVDYVHETRPYTKFGSNTHTGGFWANGWNITKNIYSIYLYLFSQTHVQVIPVDGFLRAIAQKTWNHARMCLFGL